MLKLSDASLHDLLKEWTRKHLEKPTNKILPGYIQLIVAVNVMFLI
jgi:hypothetical protein